MKNENCTSGRIKCGQDRVIVYREGADTTTIPLPEGLEVSIDFVVEGRSAVGRLEIGHDDRGWYRSVRGPVRFTYAEGGDEAMHLDFESSSGGMMTSVRALEPHAGHYAITKAMEAINDCCKALAPYTKVGS